jgi:hypothetical protein
MSVSKITNDCEVFSTFAATGDARPRHILHKDHFV